MDETTQPGKREASGDDGSETRPRAVDSSSPNTFSSSGSNDSSDLEYAAFPEGASGGASIQSTLKRMDLNVRQTLGLVLPLKNAGGHLESVGHKIREDILTLLASEVATGGGNWYAVSKVSTRVREWMSGVEALDTCDSLSPTAGPSNTLELTSRPAPPALPHPRLASGNASVRFSAGSATNTSRCHSTISRNRARLRSLPDRLWQLFPLHLRQYSSETSQRALTVA